MDVDASSNVLIERRLFLWRVIVHEKETAADSWLTLRSQKLIVALLNFSFNTMYPPLLAVSGLSHKSESASSLFPAFPNFLLLALMSTLSSGA